MKTGVFKSKSKIIYADDFIVTAATKEIAEEAKEILRDFLQARGLELSEEKTVIKMCIRDRYTSARNRASAGRKTMKRSIIGSGFRGIKGKKTAGC